MHMRKTRLVSVRVPEDILDRLDEMLKRERFCNRSEVICALLDVATCTFQPKQLGQLRLFSSFYGSRVDVLHLEFRVYDRKEVVDFVAYGHKSTDE